MRSENKLTQQEEIEELKAIISNNFLNYIQFDLVDRSTQRDFVKKLYENDTFLKILSETMVKESGNELFHSLFVPLRDGNLLLDVDIENIFRESDNEESYILEFKQSFRTPKKMKEFFIIYSCDNDIYNNIIQLRNCAIESAVGVSASEWNKIDDAIKTMYLKGEKVENGKKYSYKLPPLEIKNEELFKHIPLQGLDTNNIRAFTFLLPENHTDYDFEFYYEVRNSLADPYYYWIAENPMHLNSIIFNYEHIKRLIGSVSANCIMGNQLHEPIHDRIRGIYTVKTNSLIWPGHGAMLVWRPKF